MTAFDSDSTHRRWRRIRQYALSICGIGMLGVGWCLLAPAQAADETNGLTADGPVLTVPSTQRRVQKPVTRMTRTTRKFPGSKFNLHILATEAFANRLVAKVDSETGEVTDFILGANVNGWQATDTQLVVDFKPNRKYAQVDFTLTGKTHSETIGRTNEAMIDTLGQHSFYARKPAYFDGVKFLTQRATTTVNANNINRGVVTSYSGLPFIGSFAEQEARRRVAEKRPITEQIAAQRVTARVNPRLNSEVDRQLADVNKLISDGVAKWLSPQGLEPDHTYATTSEDYFRYSASVKGEAIPVDTPIPSDRPHGKSLSIYVHESLFEQLVNRLNLNGLEVSDRTLEQLGKGIGDLADDETAAASLYSLVFDTQRPVFVDVVDGQLRLNLRFALKMSVGEALLEGVTDEKRQELLADSSAFPMQRVTIPLSVVNDDQQLALNPGPVTVIAAKQPTSTSDDGTPVEPVTDASSKMIEMALPAKLESLKSKLESLPNSFEIPLPSGRKLPLKITKVDARNGWLMLAID